MSSAARRSHGYSCPPPSTSSSVTAYAILFLMGVASSLPWNVFVTAEAYFAQRLVGTVYEESFVNWFSTGFNITTLMSMVIRTAIIGDRMPGAVKSIFTSLVIMLVILFGHTMLTRMPEFHGVEFFKLTMTSIIVIGCGCTIMQDGLLRLVSNFPPHFTQGMVAGQAMAGVAVAVSNFLILAASKEDSPTVDYDGTRGGLWYILATDADLSAFVYFVFVFAVVLVCLFAFIALTRMQVFRYYYHRTRTTTLAENAKVANEALVMEDEIASREKLLRDEEDREVQEELRLLDLAYKIRFHAATVFLVFMMTLMVFPGISSLLCSTNPSKGRFFRDLFVPTTFIVLNGGDFLGRWAASWWPTPSARKLFLAALARFVFCPLMMFCNLENMHHEVITTIIFKSDVFPIAFLLMVAITNGLVSTLALMQFPKMLTSSKEKEAGGTIMFFSLSVGLFTGSLVSFVLLAMLKQ